MLFKISHCLMAHLYLLVQRLLPRLGAPIWTKTVTKNLLYSSHGVSQTWERRMVKVLDTTSLIRHWITWSLDTGNMLGKICFIFINKVRVPYGRCIGVARDDSSLSTRSRPCWPTFLSTTTSDLLVAARKALLLTGMSPSEAPMLSPMLNSGNARRHNVCVRSPSHYLLRM